MAHYGEWPLAAPHLPEAVNDPGDASATHPLTTTTAIHGDVASTLGGGGRSPTFTGSPLVLLDELDEFGFLGRLEWATSSPQHPQSENSGMGMANDGFSQLGGTTSSFTMPHNLYLPSYHAIQHGGGDFQGANSLVQIGRAHV